LIHQKTGQIVNDLKGKEETKKENENRIK